jgi:hypothetical protein
MATTTATMAMTTRNVNDKALGASARHFYIASRKCDNNNNNRQRRTTSVGRQGLVRKRTT